MATTTTDAAGSDPIQNWLANGAGTEKVRITSAGNVGIGTTSPGKPLDVAGAAGTYTAGFLGANSAGQSLGVNIDAGTNSSDTAFQVRSAVGSLFLKIRGDGNVGLGTSSPTVQLQLTDVMQIQGQNAPNYPASGVGIELLYDADLNTNGTGIIGVYDRSGSTARPLSINPNGGNVGIGTTGPGAALDVRGSVIINEDGADKDVRIEGDTDANLFFTDASADKIGIGTNAPAAKLHVKCDGSSADQLRLENSGTGGKVWQIGDGVGAAGVLSIRDQTDSLTIANFNYKLFGSDKGRCVHIGDLSGTQNRFDVLVLGQEQTYAGATRDGNYIIIRLDNPGNLPFAQYTAGFRNTADTGNFQAGYITFRKVNSVDKGTLALATYNGSSLSEAIFIDQDQKVGLGTNTPVNKLNVAGAMAIGAYSGMAAPSGGFLVSGAVGIGEASPANALDVNGSMALGVFSGTQAPDSGLIVSGDVGIGTDSPSYQLELSTGDAFKASGSAWLVPSDSKLKKDVKPFTDGLNVLSKINPIKYRLNGKAGLPKNEKCISVRAEEIKPIAPYMVKPWIRKQKKSKTSMKGKVEKYLAFDGSALTFILINAVKEQQTQIKQLQTRLNKMRLTDKSKK